METVTTAILDKFSNLRSHKFWVVLVVAILGYLGGLGFTTNVSYCSHKIITNNHTINYRVECTGFN